MHDYEKFDDASMNRRRSFDDGILVAMCKWALTNLLTKLADFWYNIESWFVKTNSIGSGHPNLTIDGVTADKRLSNCYKSEENFEKPYLTLFLDAVYYIEAIRVHLLVHSENVTGSDLEKVQSSFLPGVKLLF